MFSGEIRVHFVQKNIRSGPFSGNPERFFAYFCNFGRVFAGFGASFLRVEAVTLFGFSTK